MPSAASPHPSAWSDLTGAKLPQVLSTCSFAGATLDKDCLAGRTLECKRCGHLVDWKACKRAAFNRHPAVLRIGDGCLGRRCGTRSANEAKRVKAMRRYCTQLEEGERRLAAWPDSVHDTDVWERPDASRERVTWHVPYAGRGRSRGDEALPWH